MKQAIYVLMAMLLVGVVSAGTIADDCTRTDTKCVETNKVCTHWHWGHCQQWSNVCVQYEEYCTDSIETETDIDADTVQGVDVVKVIGDNDARWSKDSSGTSMSSVQRWAFGDFVDFLKGLFALRTEYEQLEDKSYELEAKLYFMENNIEYDYDMLLFKAAELEMNDKNTTSVDHGEYSCYYVERMLCLRSI